MRRILRRLLPKDAWPSYIASSNRNTTHPFATAEDDGQRSSSTGSRRNPAHSLGSNLNNRYGWSNRLGGFSNLEVNEFLDCSSWVFAEQWHKSIVRIVSVDCFPLAHDVHADIIGAYDGSRRRIELGVNSNLPDALRVEVHCQH